MREFDVPEVLEVQVVPSDEVRMVPESPTDTNNPLELVVSSVVVVVPEFSVDSSFSSLQEMTVKLKRKRERIICRFLFIIFIHK